MKTEITPSEHTNHQKENEIGHAMLSNREKYSAQIELPDIGNEGSLQIKAFLDKSPMAAAFHRMIFDAEGKPVDYLYLDANERFIQIIGVDPCGKLVTEVFPDILNDSTNWIKTFGDVVLSDSTIRFSRHIKSSNRWYDCLAFSYKPHHFLVTSVDITESKNNKQEIQDIANYFQTIIENAPDGIALLDAEGQLKFISVSGRRMFGYLDDEPANIDPAEKTHPDDLDYVLSHLMRVMTDPSYTPTLQYRFSTKNGDWIWVETRFRNLLHDPNISAVIMNFRDITKERTDTDLLNQLNYRLATAFKTADMAWWEMDIATGAILFDKRKAEMLGYEPENFNHYLDFMALVHPDDNERVMNAMRLHFSGTKKRYEATYRIASKTGEYLWFYDIGTIVERDKNGAPLKVTGIVKNVTETKLAELAIHEKEHQYFSLANSSPALIWTSGADKLCNYFNSTWLSFTGRTLEQELGNGWTEGVHPDDLEQCLATYVNAFDKQVSFQMEYRLRHVSGNYRWILDIGTPNYNGEGKFIGYIGNCVDISERKEVENQLQLSEIKFRDTFEYAVVAKSITSIEGRVSVNQAFCDLLGYTREELSLMNWRYFTHPEDIENNDIISSSILNGVMNSANWIKRYIHKDGRIIWVNVTTILLRDNAGDPIHFVTEVFDISARKKAEDDLKESEHRFDSLLQHLETGIVVHAPDTSIIMSNPRASEILGLSYDQLSGKTAIDGTWGFIDINESPLLLENYPVNRIKNSKNPIKNQIIGIRKSPNKEITWGNINGFPVLNSLGEITEIVISFNDITEQRIAEQKLVESELFFRQSQEAARIGSYNLDIVNGKWTSSKVLDEIFGIDDKYIRSIENWASLIDERDRYMIDDYSKNFVSNQKQRFNKEYRIVRKTDGKVIWVHGIGELIIGNGEIISMVGTVQDITDRKNAELELQENMDTLQRFNKLTVGRELNMIELKKEVNELLIKLGQESKYKIIE